MGLFKTLLAALRRILGIHERPPDEPAESTENPASHLRDAASAKSRTAESLRTADREELTSIAGRKEEEAALLRQLADEMELRDTRS